jgi:hypothetical protein
MWVYERVYDFENHEYKNIWRVGHPLFEGIKWLDTEYPTEDLAREEVHYLNGGN